MTRSKVKTICEVAAGLARLEATLGRPARSIADLWSHLDVLFGTMDGVTGLDAARAYRRTYKNTRAIVRRRLLVGEVRS